MSWIPSRSATIDPRLVAGSDAAPPDLERHELGRLRAAATHACRVFPGPVGELLARELLAHAELGYRFGADALLPRLAREVLALAGPSDE